MRALLTIVVSFVLAGPMSAAQRPAQLSQQVRSFVKVDAQVIALTNARVIDGTGAPAKSQQTILIQDDKIVALGPTANVTVPQGATVIDLTGKTVIPGLVMLHDTCTTPSVQACTDNWARASYVCIWLAESRPCERAATSTA